MVIGQGCTDPAGPTPSLDPKTLPLSNLPKTKTPGIFQCPSLASWKHSALGDVRLLPLAQAATSAHFVLPTQQAFSHIFGQFSNMPHSTL